MRRIWLVPIAILLMLTLLVMPPVQQRIGDAVSPWTARGVAQRVVYCPDGMVVVPKTVKVTDDRLWSEGIIHFRAICVSTDKKTAMAIKGSSFLNLTWKGWKSVSTGWTGEPVR